MRVRIYKYRKLNLSNANTSHSVGLKTWSFAITHLHQHSNPAIQNERIATHKN